MITHARLVHALLYLRPGTKPLVDFIVEDNGSGPTLKDGSMLNPPTQKEIDALTVEQLDAAQAAKARANMDPVRLQILADVASLKTRLQVAESAVAEVETIKDRLTEVEKTREPPVVEEPAPKL